MLDNYQSKSSQFKVEDEKIYNIIDMMCNDDTLAKAIYYDGEDALDQPSLDDPTILKRTHILEDNIIPDIQTDVNTLINVYYDNAKLDKNNILFSNKLLRFDIWINKTNRYLDTGTRLSVIKERLNNLFGFSRDVIGKGIAKQYQSKYAPPNMFYIGYSLIYTTKESS